jgi:hypothetical protein
MAKRKSTPRGATTVTEFPVAQLANAPGTGGWISIPQELSKLNHRLYREHKNYYAEVTLNTAVATPQPVLVYTLAPTWYVLGALRAAKRMYDKAMKDERQMVDQARWHDFRLDIENDMPAAYNQLVSYGLDQAMTAAAAHTADELLPARVLDSNGVQRTFTLRATTGTVQGPGTAYNVFQEYDAMADTPIDNPAVSSGVAPYDDLIEEADTENMGNLQFRGDVPPYNGDSFDAYWVQVGELHSSPSGNQSATTGFFQAPLGLVLCVGAVDAHIDGGLTIDRTRVTVNVMPGSYKGVHSDAL